MADKGVNSVDRIAPRYIFDTRIRIRTQAGNHIAVIEGWARDLSESGLAAYVAKELTVGSSVAVEIPLAKSIKITVSARVARSLGTQYGFQFVALSAEQRALIRSAVKGRPTIPGPAR